MLKQCEGWFNEAGLPFVAIEDVGRTTPAVAPYVGVLDFIVMRGEDKLLVTVRPHLQAKHITSIRELKELYGPEYKPVRIWPSEASDGWIWRDYPIDVSACEPATGADRKPRPKRPRVANSQSPIPVEKMKPSDRPTSVYQAILSLTDEQWASLARELFGIEPNNLDVEMVMQRVAETNTCRNLDPPVEIWIDQDGFFSVLVH